VETVLPWQAHDETSFMIRRDQAPGQGQTVDELGERGGQRSR